MNNEIADLETFIAAKTLRLAEAHREQQKVNKTMAESDRHYCHFNQCEKE
jgi:hypothetical protein